MRNESQQVGALVSGEGGTGDGNGEDYAHHQGDGCNDHDGLDEATFVPGQGILNLHKIRL
jgi:hypothetical protein